MRAVCAWQIAVAMSLGYAAPTFAYETARPTATHKDTWSQPNAGLRYLHRVTDVPCHVHALVVDLARPGVRIRATPYEERWQTVSEYASRARLAAAINGGFWGMLQRASGVTAGGGARWPDGSDDDEVGFFAVTRSKKAWISPPEFDQDGVSAPLIGEAVSGKPMLVRNGKVDANALEAFPFSNLRHPRSAVGVSRDGKTVVLIVADGRQGHSRGMSLYELARVFIELGAYNAINLDGGGSSAMYVAEKGGIVNSPSGGRWEAKLGLGASRERRQKTTRSSKVRLREDGIEEMFIRGVEREVMNHIGVVAPPPEGAQKSTVTTAPANDVPEITVEPPRKAALSFGRAREFLYPVVYVVALLVPVSLGLWIWRRQKKRAASRSGRPNA